MFYPKKSPREIRPMTWDKDRHVPGWDKEDPQTQAKERANRQKNQVREDIEETGDKNGSH